VSWRHTYSCVMSAWLIAAIERLPRRVRRIGVAATLLLLVGGAVASLTPDAHSGRSVGTVRVPSRRPSARPAPPRAGWPVSARDLRIAGRVVRGFLVSYLKFAHGRAGGTSVKAVTLGLRGQLMRDRARVTPAERGRRPRVVALEVVGTAPGVLLATALVDDGGITTYPLRVTLREGRAGWLVSGENGG
jgi:hypothetical protein